MTTYSVRCRNGKCRHRQVFANHPDTYEKVQECPSCKHTDGWRLENREYNQRNLCHCSGPEMTSQGRHFPHKTTHPLCDNNPQGAYNQAKMRGVKDDDIPLEFMGKAMKEKDACPF